VQFISTIEGERQNMVRKSIRILAALFAFGLFASMTLAQTTDKAGTGTQAKTTPTKTTKPPKTELVDINSATKEALDAVFTGADTSQKIIAGRPYNTKRDLLTRKIITEDEYKKVSDKIIAHHVGDKSGKKTDTKK
jgi:DNA uptake protein ComE-like DNA-binding protein